jgi:hypothetical protein
MFLAAVLFPIMLASPPVREVVIVSAGQLAAHRINIPVQATRPQPLSRNMNQVEDNEVLFSRESLGAVLLLARKLGEAHPRLVLYMRRDLINRMNGHEICLPYEAPLTSATAAGHAYTEALYQVLDDTQEYWKFEDAKECIVVAPNEAHDPMFLDLATRALGNNFRKFVPTS